MRCFLFFSAPAEGLQESRWIRESTSQLDRREIESDIESHKQEKDE